MSEKEKKTTKKEAPVEAEIGVKEASDVIEKKSGKKPEGKGKASAKDKVSTLSITLKRSAIGRSKDQKAALIGLGFKKLNQTVVLKDNPETRGMIKKVSHLVTVE